MVTQGQYFIKNCCIFDSLQFSVELITCAEKSLMTVEVDSET